MLIVAALLGGLYLYLRTSIPKLDGTLTVGGLDAPVTIQRDTDGIPHIIASDAHDAYFAVGFVHGQDRRFQMDVLRRYGAGEQLHGAAFDKRFEQVTHQDESQMLHQFESGVSMAQNGAVKSTIQDMIPIVQEHLRIAQAIPTRQAGASSKGAMR